jgi:hypothetical protein
VFGRKTALGLLTGALAATGVVGGGAAVWAASAKPSQPGNVIQACVGRHGVLRLALRDGCHGREALISWNQQGPAGPAGPGLNPTPLAAVQSTPPTTAPVTSTAFGPIAGLSLSLQPGTYLINADLRGVIYSGGAPGCGLVGRLAFGPTVATATTAIADSQRLVLYTPVAVSNLQGSASIHVIYTAAGSGPTVVQVQAAQAPSPNACLAGTGIATDMNGASAIDAVRIN